MAIYNVNKDTGDITETAGKYGSSNSVFYGTIAQWNALTTEQKKTYDHASIPDSLDGNVTFPASKVMMLDGESVEDTLDACAIGQFVNIGSYNSVNNVYTAPSEGYVRISGNSSTIGYIGLIKSASGSIIATATKELPQAIFIKKGTKVIVYGGTEGTAPASGLFIPISGSYS